MTKLALSRREPADPISAVQRRVLAVSAVFYAGVLSRGSFDLLAPEPLGLLFNSMLDHMLQGRWDVDPASIGYEGFVRDGATYAYFGPLPAMLRLPLTVLSGWRGMHVERLSCWLAIMIGIAAQSRAVVAALAGADGATRAALAPPLVWTCALSGPPLLLGWKGAALFHEALLWAWACAMVFAALAVPAAQGTRPIGGRRLCGLAACAGLCLLARSTTGAGLCLTTGLLILSATREGWRQSWRRMVGPLAVLGGFLGITAIVNYGRWGNALTFANLNLQTSITAQYPDRLARAARHGLFVWERLDIGLLYYLFPVWTDGLESLRPLSARLDDLYDAIEQPASSLLLTDPAWCVLSVLGIVALIRGRASRPATLLAAGLSVTPLLMLMAWYLAFRYRVEFAPLLVVLACLGLADRLPGLAGGRRHRAVLALWLLCLLQFGGTALAGYHYARQSLGPAEGFSAFSLRCLIDPNACLETGR